MFEKNKCIYKHSTIRKITKTIHIHAYKPDHVRNTCCSVLCCVALRCPFVMPRFCETKLSLAAWKECHLNVVAKQGLKCMFEVSGQRQRWKNMICFRPFFEKMTSASVASIIPHSYSRLA